MDKEIILNEATVKAVRSGGKGGQNVNKVSTKIEIYFNVQSSSGLTAEEKKIIEFKLKNRIGKDGNIRISSQDERSQIKNRDTAEKRLIELLSKSLIKPKKRIKTSVPAASSAKRLEHKKLHSEKKKFRRKDIGFSE